MMKESLDFLADTNSPGARIKGGLIEAGFNVHETPEGTIEVDSPEIHTLQLVVHSSEIIVDYIESESLQPDAGTKIVETLKELASDGGQTLRASGVLTNAEDFWIDQGFEKDGNDYIYEE